jgi:hypothetical protein
MVGAASRRLVPSLVLTVAFARSEAIQTFFLASGLLPPSPFGLWRTSRFARNDARGTVRFTCQTVFRQASAFSPHDLPELCDNDHPRNNRGRREGRELAAPMARVQKKSTRQNHRFGQVIPALPARWF